MHIQDPLTGEVIELDGVPLPNGTLWTPLTTRTPHPNEDLTTLITDAEIKVVGRAFEWSNKSHSDWDAW